MDSTLIRTNSPEETAKLARRLCTLLKSGDVLILSGDLAAGKTLLVKSIVEALGSQASVASPTYTIAHHYPTKEFPVLHIDAYRLSGAEEFRDLTLEDYYEQSLVAVEWGDIIDGVFSEYLKIEFNFVNDQDMARDIRISFKGERWRPILEAMASAWVEGV